MTAEVRNKEATIPIELAALFERHHKLVYRAAFRRTRNREDAEDVMQTVFMKLAHGTLPPDFDKNPQGYLYRAAHNEAISLARSQQRGNVADDVDLEALEIPDSTEETRRQDRMQRVRAVMATMKPKLAEMIGLHFLEDISCQEIAKIQRRPVATVYVVLWRAQRELKRRMRIKENLREIRQEENQTHSRPMVAD